MTISLTKIPRDAWGRKLMQAGDGHSAWSCNNYDCTDHPQSLYGSAVDDGLTEDRVVLYEDEAEYIGKHRDDDSTKFYGRKWFDQNAHTRDRKFVSFRIASFTW